MDEPRHRDDLPQLGGDLLLTDGGIETTLIFHRGLDLPEFAAFDLLKDDEGIEELRAYYRPYLELARERGTGFVLESPTWRASPNWASKIGHSESELESMNRRAIELMVELRDETEGVDPIVISGCVGPEDDAYFPERFLSAEEAQAYHSAQIGTFAGTAADMITGLTISYAEEAIGIVRAADEAGMPAAILFTLETNGRLPNGQPLGEAISQVESETETGPAYFGINCAHPTHFASILDTDEPWRERLRAIKANASTMSHAELDEATELDEGDPSDLGRRHGELRDKLPRMTVLGGCCGTDQRHVGEICNAWVAAG